ncbi:hypothetical protein PybrP1_002574, partial [[Pythium] brassicae (nom. inval.)]
VNKLDRKRSQDRLHQRRHRAKRKLQLSTLEQDVKNLLAEVAALRVKRQRLDYASSTSSADGSEDGEDARNSSSSGTTTLFATSSDSTSSDNKSDARCLRQQAQQQQRAALALQVVREYFATYKYGHSAIHQNEQEAFLRKVLAADVRGVDVSGVEAVAAQWRLYGAFFWSTLLEPTAMRVRAAGELSVVEVTAELHLRLRAELAPVLCPQLARREHAEVLRTVVGNVVSVQCKFSFVVTPDGLVSSLLADIDFLGALLRVVGSLATVSEVVAGAQISMCTGVISCALPPAAAPVPKPAVKVLSAAVAAHRATSAPVTTAKQPVEGGLNYRLQLSFLLSSATSSASC